MKIEDFNGKVVKFKNILKLNNHPAQEYFLSKCLGISFLSNSDLDIRRNSYDKSRYVNVVFITKNKYITHYRFEIEYLKIIDNIKVPKKLKQKVIKTINNYHHGEFRFMNNLLYIEVKNNLEKIKVK